MREIIDLNRVTLIQLLALHNVQEEPKSACRACTRPNLFLCETTLQQQRRISNYPVVREACRDWKLEPGSMAKLVWSDVML